ncbi:hypothetical protein PQX77_001394 [Marasmius sp. AFHP31]|nr:hypothetical protein PQX77_001394 [Marasmius sp. AFHP31]
MPDNASISPKRRRLRKKWLTIADANPTISTTPLDAADYRLPGFEVEMRSERGTEVFLGLMDVDLRRENRTEWMEVEDTLAGNTLNTPPEISPSAFSYPNTPQTLVEELSPRLLSLNSPLQSPIVLLSKDNNSLLAPGQPARTPLPGSSTVALAASLSQDKENMPPHSLIPCKRKKRSEQEKLIENLGKVDGYLQKISTDFGSIGEFLRLVFWSRDPNAGEDLRGTFHRGSVCRLLQGRNTVNIIHVIRKIYQHPNSYPSADSSDDSKKQRSLAFSLDTDPANISYARPAMSSWAAQLCAGRLHRDIVTLTRNDKGHPEDVPARIATASATWEEINSCTPERSIATIKRRTPYLYNTFKYLADPRKNGVPVPRVNRPSDIRILASLNPLVVGHNKEVNGYLSLSFGIELFATQTHSDIKRILCRMGLSNSDTTVRKALKIMTKNRRTEMKKTTADQAAAGVNKKAYVFDNVQEHCDVYEGGLLRTSQMRVGTAGTEITLEDCKDNAFDLNDYLARVAENERSTLTVDKLWSSIDWGHHHDSQTLFIVKTLVDDIPLLEKAYSKDIITRFRSPPIALHRIPDDRITQIQPLGTNAEREIEIHGMKRCIEDFDGQIGFKDAGGEETTLEWISGDGATFGTFLNLQRYLAPTSLDNRDALRNKFATPELWHTKDKALKAVVENHMGPPATCDPSSLSKLYTVAGFKRPSNPKQCDHYPTARSLETIWIAQILDCWRVEFEVEGSLNEYFEQLVKENKPLPSLNELVNKAGVLVQKYVSVGGYERVQSWHRQDQLRNKKLKVKEGNSWLLGGSTANEADDTEPFDGDQTLANSILFKMQFGSWLLLSYAIRDGDMGRVMEQLKIWIFMFAGSTHQLYVTYLLELYCLLTYESSPALREAILNNYLVKFGIGIPFHEKDLMQEHHNKKLESMVNKAGGEFDGPFYRDIISPNVDNFIKSGHAWEAALGLKHHGNTHTAPSTSPELKVLQDEFKAQGLSLFRKGRIYKDHKAINLLSAGYERTGTGGKLAADIRKSSSRAKFITEVGKVKRSDLLAPNSTEETTTTACGIEPSPSETSTDISSDTESDPGSAESTSDSESSDAESDASESERGEGRCGGDVDIEESGSSSEDGEIEEDYLESGEEGGNGFESNDD